MGCKYLFARTNKKNGTVTMFPCGRCEFCMKKKARFWSMRLIWELQENYNNKGTFATLTYNQDNINEKMELEPDKLSYTIQKIKQNFKRKYNKKLKFYAAGEYGQQGRPHYHIIFLGMDARKDAELIARQWPYGFIELQDATPASIRYTTKYLQKEFDGRAPKKLIWGDLQPPFARMSQGLGAEHMAKHVHKNYNKKGQYISATIKQGEYEIGLPWYWRHKFKLTGPELISDPVETLNDKDKREFFESGMNFIDWHNNKMAIKAKYKHSRETMKGKELPQGTRDWLADEQKKNQITWDYINTQEISKIATENL